MKLLLSLISLALLGLVFAKPATDKIDPILAQKLKLGPVNIFVSFVEGTDRVLQSVSETIYSSRGDLLTSLTTALKLNAVQSQNDVRTFLDINSQGFSILWLTNQLYIRNAPENIVESLARFSEVSSVTEEEEIPLSDPTPTTPIFSGRPNAAEWGIVKIMAEEGNMYIKNRTGSTAAEVIVATIDTGVRLTHEALESNYLGTYGWFDPYLFTTEPNDQNGHGTHTTGTICGKGGIGVYPDAKWMACKGCATASCAQYALLDCAQFFVCPTLPDGSSPDCTKAPHLVSNSWGGGRGANWYDAAIAAFHVAKIIPLFSIGNSGSSCNTANSPGDRDVIGVGSTTFDENISSFSSIGPSVDGKMKPDISAPGSNVVSAYNTGDRDYRSLSGTSMACPHAAGLTAQLLALEPTLSYKDVTKFMFGGVDTEPLYSSGKVCSDDGDKVFPNNVYGYGRINSLKSLQSMFASKSK